MRYATINRFPGYRFGEDGSVWSAKSGSWRQLSPSRDSDGYRIVPLSICGKRYMSKVPRIILEAFTGEAPTGFHCCHNNGVKDDDRLDNLRWDTPLNNERDKRLHGTNLLGERHWAAKLTECDVKLIRATYERGHTCTRIAKWFGVDISTAWDIANHRSWTHV